MIVPSSKLHRFQSRTKAILLFKRAFTLVEFLAVVGILAVLVSIALPQMLEYRQQAKYARAIKDLEAYVTMVLQHRITKGTLPANWEEMGFSKPPTDPWGNDYFYLNHHNLSQKQQGARKRFKGVVPINSDFDLYSTGPDGSTNKNILAKDAQDDVIVAGDGSYVGIAENY